MPGKLFLYHGVLGPGLGDSHISRVSQSSLQLWKVGNLNRTLEMSSSERLSDLLQATQLGLSPVSLKRGDGDVDVFPLPALLPRRPFQSVTRLSPPPQSWKKRGAGRTPGDRNAIGSLWSHFREKDEALGWWHQVGHIAHREPGTWGGGGAGALQNGFFAGLGLDEWTGFGGSESDGPGRVLGAHCPDENTEAQGHTVWMGVSQGESRLALC